MSTAMLALVSAFALVLAVELPDKTLVATLVLTTRFRAWPVLAGVAVAFATQCVIAVLFGHVLTLLPSGIVEAVVIALFGFGAVMLLCEGFSVEDEAGEDAARSGAGPVSFLRASVTSFGVLFAAEWGDASQLATAGLTVRYGHPIAVGVGAFVALVAVATIAVLVGAKARARIRPKMLQRVAGFAFAAFTLLAIGHAFAG